MRLLNSGSRTGGAAGHKKTAIALKFAVSALVIGTVAIGCTPGGSRISSASSSTPRADKQAVKQARRATAAIQERKADDAVRYAEAAVALLPRDAGYRATLGQAYLLAGRFQSAETAFNDAITLGDGSARAELNLALAQIAVGKNDIARDRIAGLDGRIGEADRGLALALAGDVAGALAILETAARDDNADAKTRQNLALAYALNGRWVEAQSTAAQDLTPEQLMLRMREWALFAQPRAAWDQIAHLMQVTPAADPGQPVALALAPSAAPVALAMADPVADPVTETAAIMPATDLAGTAFVEQRPDAVVPMMVGAAATPEVRAVSLIAAPAARARPADRNRLLVAQRNGGRYVVQLGAFSNRANVQAAWNGVVRRSAGTLAYTPSSATFRRASGVVHRLTLAGFTTQSGAMRVCGQIKAKGGACFVRPAAGEQPMQWAAAGRGIGVALR